MTTIDPTNAPELRFRSALEAVRPELATVENDLVTINLDIPTIVTMILGTLPEVRSYRARIVDELPRYDIARFDRLETYTLAAAQAHADWSAASSPSEPIEEMNRELTELREVLVSDVSALARRRLLDGSRLTELRGANGYKNLTFDILTLSSMLRENWSSVTGKTGVQIAELDRGEQLAHRLVNAVGQREQGPSAPSAVSRTRHLAFSLLVRAYNETRRAIGYLRWHEDDLESIAPSLFTGRGGPKRKTEVKPEPTAPQPQPGPNAPSPSPQPGAVPTSTGLPNEDPLGRV